ncbi:conserved oligomeric Golgi complex subunit 4-like protein [Dinothrombium tinctorium]|uniref:Conserved oligomeric Golgi complex subunit 4 n=1 Tax=Dinothrombium tinctorium TaxID=1965070 RepID=A0A3S3QS83_9ACAR|nr:conserved oligomeric Golgi complex subunit 4-like protein [Dinothrombium tinctorium]
MSSIEEVIKRCEELAFDERQLNEEIDALLDYERHFESCMQRIHKRMPKVHDLLSDSNQLAERVNFTSALSYSVSYKVRKLDLAKSRVTQCLQRIGDILDLKYCFDGIYKALSNEDYEQGAAHIHRFLSMDESVLRKSAEDETNNGEADNKNEVMSASAIDEAFAKLHEAQDKLQSIVIKKFDEAVRDDDVASVERFFKIFPLLNQREEGLRKFSNYLSAKIGDQALMKAVTSATQINKLTALYESVAKIIDIHQPLVETYYGHGNLIIVIEVLQKECDRRAKKIIEDFKNSKNFSQIISSVMKSMKAASSSSTKIDSREIDLLLSEVILVNCRTEKYFKFISQRARNDIEIAYNEESDQKQEKLNRIKLLLRNCELSHVIQELSGTYVLLEEYFLKESCIKAVELDDIDSSGSLTSSMLDDIFFIANKCIKRAISGGNADVLCAIINNSISIIESSFCDTANERLRYGYPSTGVAALDLSQAYNALQTGRYLQSYSDIEKTKLLFLVVLNNLDTACDLIKSIRKNVSEEAKKVLDDGNQKQQTEKFESCISDFSSLIYKFQSLIASGLNQLYSSALKPRIKSWIDSFLAATHTLNEEEILRYEVTDGLRPFTQSFIMNIDTTLKSLKQSLTSNNYTNLVNIFTTDLANRLETAISKCQFNKIGGFQFDRELRAIITYLTSLTTWSVRDKFVRLKDISIILNLESLNEISEYFNFSHTFPNDASSRLSPNDVRQFLKLRVEFTSDEIRKVTI